MKVMKPKRVTRTYIQDLAGDPAEVFPLLCPVREADWIDGWDPPVVLSNSGVAELDCVFVTEAEPIDAVWYISAYKPEIGFLEMIKITPTVTACKVTIELRAVEGGSEATVTYSHTSLGPKGDTFVAGFTEEYYEQFMDNWEALLNHYLREGTALREDDE